MQNHASSSIRANRFRGFLWGLFLALAALLTIFVPELAWVHAPGHANIGHEDVICTGCHKPAQGTLRQQLQAKVRYIVGLRQSDVVIGHEPVSNAMCVGCHSRKSDSHPVDRFASRASRSYCRC